MTNIEWLNMRKEVCEHGIEIYYDKIKEFERELEVVKRLISLAEGQPADDGTAQ
jgi:chorismate mutase